MVLYPAREIALKIKEVSYAHAEVFIAGELKHEVIALIEKNTPVLYLATQKENHDDLLNAAIEVKSREVRLIGLTDFNNSVFDDWLRVDFYPRYQAISMIIVGQLFAYELSVLRGFNPDRSRNLAKSVTVN